MARGFNWTKIAKQDQMRRNGTREVEAMTKRFLNKNTRSGKVRSRPKTPIVFEWDPPRS